MADKVEEKKRHRMRINRILVSIGLFLIVLVYWEARLKPQSRPLYDTALSLYKGGQYEASLAALDAAYRIEPNSTAILVLMGWDQLKLRRFEEARANFGRATRLDPDLVEAQLGLLYVQIETSPNADVAQRARALLASDPGNHDFQLAAAAAARESGNNRDAQVLLTRLLDRPNYGPLARRLLEDMYGIDDPKAEIPEGLPPYQRPGQTWMKFRAGNGYLQAHGPRGWSNFYVRGVNIGPATPGHYASEAPNRADVYGKWLEQIARLGANTIRVYTLLPPAFYRAVKTFNEHASTPLYLMQEIWLVSPEEKDFFSKATDKASRDEIQQVVDAIHGQGDVPMRQGHASGMYTVDVSPWVAGYLVGRELEPHLVLANNARNFWRTTYTGRYVSVPDGTPTETWLASMMDYTAQYEMDKYNAQRPLSIVNWPPLDPLNHPTEAPFAQEIEFRRRAGERLGRTPEDVDDNDEAAVDDAKLRAGPAQAAGIFSSYHVYPFYPDFLLYEPALLAARDYAGQSPYFGYLQALKKHYGSMPLLVAEYGIPTSIGVSHFHPLGWNHGGFNEREQGDMLARMTRDIADSGCAGGLVFEWQDEWFKTNWLTSPFEVPFEHREQWLNALDPEENFGLWSNEPSGSKLFSNDASLWQSANTLYEKSAGPQTPAGDGDDAQRTLRRLQVSSDEAFVYLRLDLAALPEKNGQPDLEKTNYLVGITTSPDHYGSRLLPGIVPHLRVPSGFNFLLHVAGVSGTRLLAAHDYNAYAQMPVEGVKERTTMEIRVPFKPGIEEWSPFEEMTVETNRIRYGRDGRVFPPHRYSRSLLRYGTLDRNSASFDSLATWGADFRSHALVFRLPWSLLYVTDPSARQVYDGATHGPKIESRMTEGLGVFALSFRADGRTPDWSRLGLAAMPAVDTLPVIDKKGDLSGVKTYRWEEWRSVNVAGRLKSSASAVENSFRDLKRRGL